MPTVSVVLPTYNGERYIRESIDSIIGQTFTDWELIIVDDCSEDNTPEIAREYQGRDDRILVIHNEINRGLPESLNVGFRHAKGKYFTWTSDDNRYLPDAIAVMVEKLEISDAAMVCADEQFMDEIGELRPGSMLSYKDDALYRWNTVGACFLYRGEVSEDIGSYDTSLFGTEDYDYWLRIKERYGEIQRIDRVLYHYRLHEASVSNAKKEMVRQALIQLRKKHLDFILADLKNRKDFLISFYYEMMEMQTMDEEIRKKILAVLPEVNMDVIEKSGKYIIFGAGEYGKRALEELKNEVAFFADNNMEKVGKYIGGKEVLSFRKMVLKANQYHILVAVHGDKVWQLVLQLKVNGIERYCTWQTYQWEKHAFRNMAEE